MPDEVVQDTLLTSGEEGAEEGAEVPKAEVVAEAPKAEVVAEAPKAEVGAPETYTDFKFPEGVEADPAMVTAFAPVAKEIGLTQAQAQSVFDLQVAGAQSAISTQTKEWADTVAVWKTETEKAEDIDVALAKKAVNELGTPELKEALNSLGVGNHPEFVRMYAKVGVLISRLEQALGEDNIDFGKMSVEVDVDPAKVLFGGS